MGLRFPVFLDIEDKSILVVGAGYVAVRRIRTLLLFGADITVVAREVPEEQRQEMEEFLETGKVRLVRKCLEASDITPKYLFVACAADDPEADRMAWERCRELDIPVNIASDRKMSDFYFAAVVTGEDLAVGIAGDGTDHGKTARAAALIRRCLARSEETKKDKEDRA